MLGYVASGKILSVPCPRAFLTCKEEGRERLDLSKSNISSLPAR